MKLDFSAERAAYDVLKKVFSDRAYSSIELDRILVNTKPESRGKVTALVYGVLEKSVRLDYIISQIADKVKTNIYVLLKMGIYELLYGNEPDYAVVGRYVSFAKNRMYGAHGFVNAVLRKARDVQVPDKGADAGSLSLRFSQPEWVISRFMNDFGLDKTVSVFGSPMCRLTHIRNNSRKIGAADFEIKIKKIYKNSDILRTDYGYYVTHSALSELKRDEFTAQSLASCRAVNIYSTGVSGKIDILDLCAAPGGKSIYLQELLPYSDITSCDVHAHRVRLIRSYADRMGAKLNIMENDATKLREEWRSKFGLVVCDVPCSGSGLAVSSPDVVLFKSESDLSALTELQYNILSVASEYVKAGGEIAYSTCSVFVCENEDIIKRFLSEHDNFEIVGLDFRSGANVGGMIRLFPDTDGCDGFFVTKLRRTK